jgi:hypothetical protein
MDPAYHAIIQPTIAQPAKKMEVEASTAHLVMLDIGWMVFDAPLAHQFARHVQVQLSAHPASILHTSSMPLITAVSVPATFHHG